MLKMAVGKKFFTHNTMHSGVVLV